MPNEVKRIEIDVKRTGFPVSVGEVELYFDSSIESLRKFLTLDEQIDKKTAELQDVIKDMPDMSNPQALAKDYDKAQIVLQKQAELSWDITFGEGTFNKLYEKYPDIWALSEAFDAVGEAIGKRIEEMAEERIAGVQELKKEALAKKAKKTAKK